MSSSHGEFVFTQAPPLRYQEIIFCIVEEGRLSIPTWSPHLGWILCDAPNSYLCGVQGLRQPLGV